MPRRDVLVGAESGDPRAASIRSSLPQTAHRRPASDDDA